MLNSLTPLSTISSFQVKRIPSWRSQTGGPGRARPTHHSMDNNKNRSSASDQGPGPAQQGGMRRKSRAGNLPPAFDEAVVQGAGQGRRSSVGQAAMPGRRSSIVATAEDTPPLSGRKGGDPPLSGRKGGERRSSVGGERRSSVGPAPAAGERRSSVGPAPAAGERRSSVSAAPAAGERRSSVGATPPPAGQSPGPTKNKNAASAGEASTVVARQQPGQAAAPPRGGKKAAAVATEKSGKTGCGRRCAMWWHKVYMSWVNCMVTMPCYSFDVYKYSAEVARHHALFTSLGLQEKEIGVFYIWYNRIDMDHSNSVTIHELLEFLGVEQSDFSHRVFSIFDEDGNGTVDFREFVVAMWNYSTLNLASLVLFAFDLYDKDGSGELELAEIKKMLVEVYGEGYANNVHARQIVVDLHDRMGVALGMPVYMKVADFAEFCHQHPAMLMPAFIFQDALRSRICGGAFWDRCTRKRLQLGNGQYVSIGTLMQAAVNEDVARGVMAADRMGKDHQIIGGGSKDSQAVGFIKNIGGSLARRRGSNDLGQDKVREVLERATKAREEAARQAKEQQQHEQQHEPASPPQRQQQQASPSKAPSGAGKNEAARVTPIRGQANVQSLGMQAHEFRDEQQRGRVKNQANNKR